MTSRPEADIQCQLLDPDIVPGSSLNLQTLSTPSTGACLAHQILDPPDPSFPVPPHPPILCLSDHEVVYL